MLAPEARRPDRDNGDQSDKGQEAPPRTGVPRKIVVLIARSPALGLIGVGIWLRRSHSGSRAEVRRASDGAPGSSAETPARPTGVGRLDLIDDLVATAIQEHKL